jgi:hypothetical protein
MRRPKRDKRSELAVKYCCDGSIRSQGKTGIQSVAAVSSTNVWAVFAGLNPQFEQLGRSSVLVSAGELHVRSGVRGL